MKITITELRAIIHDVLLDEIIKKCGDKYCLYSKKKKNGKHKRLGTHPSKAAAKKQEIAIQYSKAGE